MAIRREQALLLGVLVLGVLVYGGLEPGGGSTRLPGPSKAYEGAPVPSSPLVPPRATAELPSRDLFREPSESSPLPPRPLPFPDREPLPLVAVPLPTGPDAGHYHLLRIPGDVVQGVTLEAPEQTVEPQQPSEDPVPGTLDRDRLERLYDQVVPAAGGDVFYGLIEGADKYELAERRMFDETVTFRLRQYQRRTGTLAQGTMEWTGVQVRDVILAKSLRNEVELRRRRLHDDMSSLPDRRDFLEWLLQQAREESWVYGEAARQADVMIELTNGDLEAYQAKVRVFREQGDLEKERSFYASLPEHLRGTAFHDEGTGQLRARLGLYDDAEADLRRAMEKSPNDPLVLGSLAYFLLERGRAEEARPVAERALRFVNRLTPELGMRVRTAAVAALLAVGELDRARDAMLGMGSNGAAELNVLRAALAYARGDIESADTLFRNASAATRTTVIFGLNPLLGVAALHLRAGRFDEALASFESVADEAPLLRHRALSGVGLLYMRIGQFDEALSALERALTVDPYDAYSLYLQGRCQRMVGELDAAVVSLEEALAVRDDLLEALAEMAATYLALAEEQPGQEAAHLFRAMRYADRLVELDAERSRSARFCELQGRIHFRARDLRGAREAFARGLELAENEAERLHSSLGLSLVDYAQGRTQIAWGDLQDLAARRPIGDPFRGYAQETIRLIDEHAQKEQVQDRFEREGPELGSIWETETQRSLRLRLRDGRIEFRGRFDSEDEAFVRRLGALPTGGALVSLEVTLQEEAPPFGAGSISGLRLMGASRTGRIGRGGNPDPDFLVQFGLSEGQPYLLILDGRARDQEPDPAREPVPSLAVDDLDPRGPQHLELRVDAAADGTSGNEQLVLTALWNGQQIHQRPLSWLRRNTRPELYADLYVHGRRGAADIAVNFDDFRLVRRKQ